MQMEGARGLWGGVVSCAGGEGSFCCTFEARQLGARAVRTLNSRPRLTHAPHPCCLHPPLLPPTRSKLLVRVPRVWLARACLGRFLCKSPTPDNSIPDPKNSRPAACCHAEGPLVLRDERPKPRGRGRWARRVARDRQSALGAGGVVDSCCVGVGRRRVANLAPRLECTAHGGGASPGGRWPKPTRPPAHPQPSLPVRNRPPQPCKAAGGGRAPTRHRRRCVDTASATIQRGRRRAAKQVPDLRSATLATTSRVTPSARLRRRSAPAAAALAAAATAAGGQPGGPSAW
jgi:hypothetical protein